MFSAFLITRNQMKIGILLCHEELRITCILSGPLENFDVLD